MVHERTVFEDNMRIGSSDGLLSTLHLNLCFPKDEPV
jgi:hypothetical protein